VALSAHARGYEPESKGCPEKASLTAAYERCVREHLDAVAAVTAVTGGSTFRARCIHAEAKRVACEKARATLDEHLLGHKC
jgi:hypothetical protein